MRGHHRQQCLAQPAVGCGIVGQKRLQRAFVHRQLMMGIGMRVTVTRKVLAAVGHSREQQAMHQAAGQQRDHPRVAMKGSIADHPRRAVVQIEHRGEAQVHPHRLQLAPDGRPDRGGLAAGVHRIDIPALAQRPHRFDRTEAVPKTLNPPALVIHADQQRAITSRAHISGEPRHLPGALEVAGEQDHAAHPRMGQAFPVLRSEARAGDIDDHRAGLLVHERSLLKGSRNGVKPSRASMMGQRAGPAMDRLRAVAAASGAPLRSPRTQPRCRLRRTATRGPPGGARADTVRVPCAHGRPVCRGHR